MAKDKLNYEWPMFSFYRPHARVPYTGEIVNPVTGEVTVPPSMTKQSFVEECDINNVLREYSQSGQLRHISQRAEQGMYTDLPDNTDFQEALNIVLEGQKAFDSLPAKVRNRFNNDPAAFLEFMADPANQDEAIKLGLATDNRPPPEPTTPAPAPPPARPEPNTGGEGGLPLA